MRERPLVPSTFNFLSCSELAIQCEMKLEKKWRRFLFWGLSEHVFGASGVQKAKCVPSSTIRTAPALGWLSRNLELLLDASSFPERKAPLMREVVRARSVAQHRNTGEMPKPARNSPTLPAEAQCKWLCWCLRDPGASLPSGTQRAPGSSGWLLVWSWRNPRIRLAVGMGMGWQAGTGQGGVGRAVGRRRREDGGAAQLLQRQVASLVSYSTFSPSQKLTSIFSLKKTQNIL